jgi:hypothetical protein
MGAALVAFVYLAGEFNLQASAISETRAGEAPVTPGARTNAFIAEIVMPVGGFELRRPDLVFTGWYGPRIYWEDPNPLSQSGPLVLHTAALQLDARASRRVSLSGTATGSIGQPDYMSLPQVLGAVQATLPKVADLASVSGQARVVALPARRWEVDFATRIFYWQWLDTPTQRREATLPDEDFVNQLPTITGQTLIGGEPTLFYSLDHRNTIGFGANVTAVDETSYTLSWDVFTVSPGITWKRRLSPTGDMLLVLGATYAQMIGPTPFGITPPLGRTGHQASPVGSIDVGSRFMRYRTILFEGRAKAGVDYYIDPVLGTAVPRALADVAADALDGYWSYVVRADFATALRETPYAVVGPRSAVPDETVFSLAVAARHQLSPNLLGEVGALWADRAPAFVTPDFAFHQRQLWAYISISATTKPLVRVLGGNSKRIQ